MVVVAVITVSRNNIRMRRVWISVTFVLDDSDADDGLPKEVVHVLEGQYMILTDDRNQVKPKVASPKTGRVMWVLGTRRYQQNKQDRQSPKVVFLDLGPKAMMMFDYFAWRWEEEDRAALTHPSVKIRFVRPKDAHTYVRGPGEHSDEMHLFT